VLFVGRFYEMVVALALIKLINRSNPNGVQMLRRNNSSLIVMASISSRDSGSKILGLNIPSDCNKNNFATFEGLISDL
jgi:hypothetical protein